MMGIVLVGCGDPVHSYFCHEVLAATDGSGFADGGFQDVSLNDELFAEQGDDGRDKRRDIIAHEVKSLVESSGCNYVVTVDQRLFFANSEIKKRIQNGKDGSGNFPRLLHLYEAVAMALSAEGIGRIAIIGSMPMMTDKRIRKFFSGRHGIQVVGARDMQEDLHVIHGFYECARQCSIGDGTAMKILVEGFVRSLAERRGEFAPQAVVILDPFLSGAIGDPTELAGLPAYNACDICVDALVSLWSK